MSNPINGLIYQLTIFLKKKKTLKFPDFPSNIKIPAGKFQFVQIFPSWELYLIFTHYFGEGLFKKTWEIEKLLVSSKLVSSCSKP